MSTEAPRRRRKWFRLSVRGMMLAVLAVALGLGWHLQKVREQREAEAAVHRYGGLIYYANPLSGMYAGDAEDGNTWHWQWGMFGDESFQYVKRVILHNLNGFGDGHSLDSSPDEALKGLAKLSGIKVLELWQDDLTSESFFYIGKMSSLERLNIVNGDRTTDSEIECLRGLKNLKSITIKNSWLGDEGIVLLSSLPVMEEMEVEGSRITDAGLTGLLGENRIKTLCLSGKSTCFSDKAIGHLKTFAKLNRLSLTGSRVTPKGLLVLSNLPELRDVSLWIRCGEGNHEPFDEFYYPFHLSVSH